MASFVNPSSNISTDFLIIAVDIRRLMIAITIAQRLLNRYSYVPSVSISL